MKQKKESLLIKSFPPLTTSESFWFNEENNGRLEPSNVECVLNTRLISRVYKLENEFLFNDSELVFLSYAPQRVGKSMIEIDLTYLFLLQKLLTLNFEKEKKCIYENSDRAVYYSIARARSTRFPLSLSSPARDAN